MNVVAVGVKENELELYKKLNSKFSFNLKCYNNDVELNCSEIYQDMDVVIDGNATQQLGDEYFSLLEKNGIKYLILKMTGYGQVDLNSATKHGISVANISAYSPNAISELVLGMAISLNRKLPTIQLNASKNDFCTEYDFFREIRDCTIGILGCGNIGITTAKLFKGLGAKIIGYDKYPNTQNERYLSYCDLDTVISTSDIICIHMPYIKGENYHIINYELLKKAKRNLILINAARGELVDTDSIVKAIKEGIISSYGTDVLEGESDIYTKKVKKIENPSISALLDLYPNVLITPHIGAYTMRARSNMIELAFEEAEELFTTGTCKNLLNKSNYS